MDGSNQAIDCLNSILHLQQIPSLVSLMSSPILSIISQSLSAPLGLLYCLIHKPVQGNCCSICNDQDLHLHMSAYTSQTCLLRSSKCDSITCMSSSTTFSFPQLSWSDLHQIRLWCCVGSFWYLAQCLDATQNQILNTTTWCGGKSRNIYKTDTKYIECFCDV